MRGKIKFSQLSLKSMLLLTTTGLEAPMLKLADIQPFLYQLLIDSSYKVHINMEKTKNYTESGEETLLCRISKR